MIINGVELEYDAYDRDLNKKIQQYLAETQNVEKALLNETDVVVAIEKSCQPVFDFFDKVFGEGTSKKIFGDKVSLTLCMDAYEAFFAERDRQDVEIKRRTEKMKKRIIATNKR